MDQGPSVSEKMAEKLIEDELGADYQGCKLKIRGNHDTIPDIKKCLKVLMATSI